MDEVVCWNCDETAAKENTVRYTPAEAARVAGPHGEHPKHDVLICIPCHIAIREYLTTDDEEATSIRAKATPLDELDELRALARCVAKLEALPMWTKTRNGTQMWALTGVESVQGILADAKRLAAVEG